MWSLRLVLATLAVSLPLQPGAQAFESLAVDMWECPGPDGTVLYTNKERPECQPKVLQALSVVPSPPDLPLPSSGGSSPSRQSPRTQDLSYDTPIGAVRNFSQVPDSARDWYAANAGSGSVHTEVCSMYAEWIHLNQNTRGGHLFGTDPSYGGNPTTQNWYAPSYSFSDNARYLALSQIFGAGFIPIGCR